MKNIPFNKRFLAGKKLDCITHAAPSGNVAGDGHFTRQCSRLLEERFGIHKVPPGRILTPRDYARSS
jgi:dTDP-4-amino-4,6-dideoxygalactose transaminase